MKSSDDKGPTLKRAQEVKDRTEFKFPSPGQFHRVEFRKGVDPKAAVAELAARLRAERSKR